MKTLIGVMILTAALIQPAFAQGRRGRDNAPQAGQEAPNFKAKKVGKNEFVELKQAVGRAKKPVVLIFGSTT